MLALALVYCASRSALLNYLICRLVFLKALFKSISDLVNNISSLANPQKAERLEKAITNEQAVRCHYNSVRYIAWISVSNSKVRYLQREVGKLTFTITARSLILRTFEVGRSSGRSFFEGKTKVLGTVPGTKLSVQILSGMLLSNYL